MWKYLVAVAVLTFAALGLILQLQNKQVKRENKTNKRKMHVPKIMLDLYHQNANGNVITGPDIVRSVIPKTTGFSTESKSQSFETKHVLIFEVPKYRDEEFLSAELKILSIVEAEFADLETIFKISLFDDANGNVLYLDRVRFHRRNSTWLSFNLTAPIASVLTNATPRIRIVIALKSLLEGVKLTLLPDEENFEHDYPILLLSYNSKLEGNATTVSSRNKRSVFEDDYQEDVSEKSKRSKKVKNVCKRKALYVDFAEINYDTWIVQPSGYEAYQCHGKCFYPVADHLSPTKHAIVQALIHSVAPSKAPRSCCVPTKLDSISVLYIDTNGVLTYRYAYKDMVVSECGCR